MPVAVVNKNPPLVSYALAAWAAIGGWSERWLHAFFWIPALAVVLGTHRLARSVRADPLVAALATLVAPAFLVSCTTTMSDVPMLALFVVAAVVWVEGVQRQRPALLLAAGALTAAAALTKYFAISLVPLLAAYALAARTRVRVWLPALALPLAVLAGYQGWSAEMYGRGLLNDAAAYASGYAPDRRTAHKVLVGLAFAGGGAPVALLAAPGLLRRRTLALLLAALVGAMLLAPPPLLAEYPTPGQHVQAWPGLAAQFVLFVAGGLAGLLLAVRELRRAPGDAGAWLLSLWVAGTLAFAAWFNWSVTMRSVLPLVPALALLVGRAARAGSLRRAVLIPALAVSAALALAVAWGDYAQADTARAAVREIDPPRPGGATTWFLGHWGFQWYMEARGARAIDLVRDKPRAGDLVVRPLNNTNIVPVAGSDFRLVRAIQLPLAVCVSTMQLTLGTGFYSDAWGPLPYALGRCALEGYEVYRAQSSGPAGP
jgi:4-amino-4-deoxy-L-arabinose transferase-like glycosyltransferase